MLVFDQSGLSKSIFYLLLNLLLFLGDIAPAARKQKGQDN